MLLSWLDRLTLFIHPQRVVFVRQPWRGTAIRQSVEVAAPVVGEADWQPALAAAESLLRANGKGGTLHIVVADHFVRYALLPWSEMITSQPARLDMARALFKSTLGDKADGLEFALDRPAFGRNGVATGLDRLLLAALRAAARASRMRLSSVQPRLIAELAAQRKHLNDGWFACLDLGWLTLAGLRGGDISSLRNHRASTTESGILASELSGLLAAEGSAVDRKKILISTDTTGAPSLSGDWEISLVQPVSGVAHA